jgi:hypothetical protein
MVVEHHIPECIEHNTLVVAPAIPPDISPAASVILPIYEWMMIVCLCLVGCIGRSLIATISIAV